MQRYICNLNFIGPLSTFYIENYFENEIYNGLHNLSIYPQNISLSINANLKEHFQ